MERAAVSVVLNKNTKEFSQLQKFVERKSSIKVDAIKIIKNGRNSQVFLIGEGDKKWIIKKYHKDKNDTRSRLLNETCFLAYLKDMNINKVADTLAVDKKNNLALFTFLPGSQPTVVNDDLVIQASNFIKKINKSRNKIEAKSLPKASESCFSVLSHIQLLRFRLKSLNKIETDLPIQKEALSFIKSSLNPSLKKITDIILSKYSDSKLKKVLKDESKILSPSDFGFQNMLLENGTIFFLDFEYAGWDDPAKLICDFGCHPEVTVEDRYVRSFQESLYSWLHDAKETIDRSEVLMKLYRLKWCCIILNNFTSVGKERRIHAGEIENYEQQFSKAKTYFERYLSWLT